MENNSYKFTTCVNCCKTIERTDLAGKSYHTLAARPRNVKTVTYWNCLSYLLKIEEDLSFNVQKSLFICSDCSNSIRNAYVYMKKFKDQVNCNSIVQNLINTGQVVDCQQIPGIPTNPLLEKMNALADSFTQVHQEIVPGNPLFGPSSSENRKILSDSWTQTIEIKKPKVKREPIGSAMKKAYKIKKFRTFMLNTFKHILKDEMSKLISVKVFSEGPGSNTTNEEDNSDNITDSFLLQELQLQCPAILSVLFSLFARNKEIKELIFNSKMRTALGLALVNKSMNCNALQKEIGLKLWKVRANKEVYDVLCEIGVTTSFKTSSALLDKLQESRNEELRQWQQNITAQLNNNEELEEEQQENDTFNLNDYIIIHEVGNEEILEAGDVELMEIGIENEEIAQVVEVGTEYNNSADLNGSDESLKTVENRRKSKRLKIHSNSKNSPPINTDS